MVDKKQLSFNSAVELSYLMPDEQARVSEVIESAGVAPSISQAQKMKKLKLHTQANDRYHHQALGRLEQEAPAEPGAVINGITDGPDRFFCPDFCCPGKEETYCLSTHSSTNRNIPTVMSAENSEKDKPITASDIARMTDAEVLKALRSLLDKNMAEFDATPEGLTKEEIAEMPEVTATRDIYCFLQYDYKLERRNAELLKI